MKRQMTRAAIMGIGIFILGGCVPARVSITSDPSGALVYVNNRRIGRTPTEHMFDFKRVRIFNLQIKMPGFLAQNLTLDRRHSMIRQKRADFQLEKDIREVVFISRPSGVTITVDGVAVGSTPSSYKFDFHKQTIYKVEMKRDGMITQHLDVDRGYVEKVFHSTMGAETTGMEIPTRVESKITMEDDPSFRETSSSRATNTWLQIQTNPEFDPGEVWQKVVSMVTSKYDTIEVMDVASGYIRTSPQTRVYHAQTRAKPWSIRTQYFCSIQSKTPLVYKIKVKSEIAEPYYESRREQHRNRWDYYELVFRNDAELIEEMYEALRPK